MALALLQLPSSLQLSSPPSNTSPCQQHHPFSFLPAATLRNRATRSLSFIRGTNPIIPLSSNSSSTASTAAVEEEDLVESSGQPRTRLIAQNIPWTSTADDIRTLFKSHGTVVDIELSMHNSSRNRGLAFVTMSSEEEALAALNNLNSYDFDGRVINVDYARSRKKNSSHVTKFSASTSYNVFVGNLAWRVRSKDLRELFGANWNVLSAEVIFQTNPRISAGYGFVSFPSKEEAEAAISGFNGKRLMGRPIRLMLRRLPTDDDDDDDDAVRISDQDAEAEDASNEKTEVEKSSYS